MTKIRVGSEYTPPENAYIGEGGTFPVVLYALGVMVSYCPCLTSG